MISDKSTYAEIRPDRGATLLVKSLGFNVSVILHELCGPCNLSYFIHKFFQRHFNTPPRSGRHIYHREGEGDMYIKLSGKQAVKPPL